MRPELRPFARGGRGKSPNPHKAGSGHGDRTYVPVRMSNRLATEEGREARRIVLAARDRRSAAYLEGLRGRVAAQRPDKARLALREARRARRREQARGRAAARAIGRRAVLAVADRRWLARRMK